METQPGFSNTSRVNNIDLFSIHRATLACSVYRLLITGGRQLRAIEVQSKYKGKIEMELHVHTVENIIIKYNLTESHR